MLLWYSWRRDVQCLMSQNNTQEEHTGIMLCFQIRQCFSFCSPALQAVNSERSQSKGCPAVHREGGENSPVTGWKVSPPSRLIMWYCPTECAFLNNSCRKDRQDYKKFVSFPHMAIGYVDLGDRKLCRRQELEAGLQVLAGTPASESFCRWDQWLYWEWRAFLSCCETGTFSAPLHFRTLLWLKAPIACFFPMCHPCASPGTGLHGTWYKPSLNDHPLELPI